MGIWNQKATKGGSYEMPPEGNHRATCVCVIDIGTHEEINGFNGKKQQNRKVYLCWEIDGHKQADGKPFIVGNEYNFFFSEKSKLRIMIETWRGKKFSDNEEFTGFDRLPGKPCFIQISHKKAKTSDKEYANIDAITSQPAGVQAAVPTVKPFIWSVEDATALPTQDWLPWIFGQSATDKIGESIEWKAKIGKTTQPAEQSPKPPQAPLAPAPTEFDRF